MARPIPGALMSDQLNWFIVPNDSSTSTLDPTTSAEYDLVNEYAIKRLIYKEREYGINLDWADLDPTAPSLNVVRQGADASPIRYGELVAIRIRGGGYLRYGERDYGINLKWSEDPVYEWQIAGSGNSAGTDVELLEAIGLFNDTIGDTLFYDPRRYGINLKWLSDKGKYNDTPWYESVTDAVGSFFQEFGRLLIEAINRVVGVIDFVLTLLGIMLPKSMRVGIVVLRHAQGKGLLADPDLPSADFADQLQKLQSALDVMIQGLKNQVNVELQTADGMSSDDVRDFYRVLPFPAPTYALDVKCGAGLWGQDFGQTGQYFRRHSSANRPFYGSPVTIFVVQDVADKVGCSLGPLTDWVVVEKAGFNRYTGPSDGVTTRPTTPMHEVGHACGLWHRGPQSWSKTPRANLMISSVPRGIQMSRLQRAVFRNSRHVTLI